MKCSTVVIEGLIKIKNSLFILSTHLYEIGDELKNYPNIDFKYFETNVEDEQLIFNYNLKDGISNDRLGYLILKREKVIELLEKLINQIFIYIQLNLDYNSSKHYLDYINIF